MSLHRTKATFIGLLEAGRVNEWIVTEKLGDALKAGKAANKAHKKPRLRFGERYEYYALSCNRMLSFEELLKPVHRLNFNQCSPKSTGSIYLSSGSELTSSSAGATILPLGKTTTSSTSMLKPLPSSSWGSDTLVHSFQTHRKSEWLRFLLPPFFNIHSLLGIISPPSCGTFELHSLATCARKIDSGKEEEISLPFFFRVQHKSSVPVIQETPPGTGFRYRLALCEYPREDIHTRQQFPFCNLHLGVLQGAGGFSSYSFGIQKVG